MLSQMLRAGLLVAVCTAFVQAAPHPGKVMRIERHSHRFAGDPRWCGVSVETMQAFCYGKQPELGASVTVMDNAHTIGVFSADKVEPLGTCRNQPALWQVHLKGDVTNPGMPSDAAVNGLLDVTANPRSAKTMKVDATFPNRVPDSLVVFDLDGNDQPDLATLSFNCDDAGEPLTSLATAPNTCVEMWYWNGHGFEKLRSDKISHTCF